MCNYNAHFLTIFGRSIRVIWREEGGGGRREEEGRIKRKDQYDLENWRHSVLAISPALQDDS